MNLAISIVLILKVYSLKVMIWVQTSVNSFEICFVCALYSVFIGSKGGAIRVTCCNIAFA